MPKITWRRELETEINGREKTMERITTDSRD